MDDLLQTKLFIPPLRPSLVPRSRLIKQLNQGKYGKLTLVSAPAGFGKTTLVVTWLKTEPTDSQTCWLSLDENDNGLPRFFTYVLAAIQTIEPELGKGLLTSLQSAQPLNVNVMALVQTLLNELAQNGRAFTLVLDDYHVITNTAVHEAITTLIDYLPPHIHLIITSREDPPLPLPRWRVRGQLVEIRADDLRFTQTESGSFLRHTMGLQLDEQAVTTLEERTEGWAAGLQLAALSLRGADDPTALISNFTGNDRHVADYLLTEVLYQQQPEVQQFLLQTAVLERMCAPLCDYLRLTIGDLRLGDESIANHNSQSTLEHLETTNLFLVPLDNQRHWYRYHHLFAQLLREKLKREMGETAVNQLHQRASQWYEANHRHEEAVFHALQAGDFENAGRLVAATSIASLWQQGGISLVQRWVQALPLTIIKQHPQVAILASGSHFIVGDVQTAARYLALAANEPAVAGEWHLLQAILLRNEGQIPQALELAQHALSLLNEPILASIAQLQLVSNYLELAELAKAEKAIQDTRQRFDRIDHNTQMSVIRMGGIIATLRADLYHAAAIYREGIQIAEAVKPQEVPMIGAIYNGLGSLHYQWHEMEEAETYYEQAVVWAQRTGITDILFDSYQGQANLACWRGQGETALDIMAQFTAYARRSHLQDIIEISELVEASYQLRVGRWETAVRWANASHLKATDTPTFRTRHHYKWLIAIRLAESRALRETSQLSALVMLADSIIAITTAADFVFDTIETLVWKALVLDHLGEKTAALASLKTALNLAHKSTIITLFIEHGEAMQALLHQIDDVHPAYIQRLLSKFPPTADLPPSAIATTASLTEREQEILQHIAAGFSNKAIEDKLFISNNTVRTHIKNLYSKLNVSSRTQAIARAHELELL